MRLVANCKSSTAFVCSFQAQFFNSPPMGHALKRTTAHEIVFALPLISGEYTILSVLACFNQVGCMPATGLPPLEGQEECCSKSPAFC